MVAQLCECTKTELIMHFKWVNCIVFEFYLNKAIKKLKREKAHVLVSWGCCNQGLAWGVSEQWE